jgi:hypothetical protein
VFSAPSICLTVQSVTFGDNLLRGVGHDFGQHFGCNQITSLKLLESMRLRTFGSGTASSSSMNEEEFRKF